MDKDVLQAVVNTLHCLDLDNIEKESIVTQWVIKSYTQTEAVSILTSLTKTFFAVKPTLSEKSTLGNIIEKYRDTSVWGDQKSYRGFIGTLIEEYSKIVKTKREIMNIPIIPEVSVSQEFRNNVASNNLILAVIERKFREVLSLIGFRSKEDAALIAEEWYAQVVNRTMSDVELSFCNKLKETIATISTKNTYSGTYNIGKIKSLYEKEDSKFPCTSVSILIGVAQRVLTTFNGTRESLEALLDYKGVDLSIEEIDAFIPEATRSTYSEDIYQRVYESLELFF